MDNHIFYTIMLDDGGEHYYYVSGKFNKLRFASLRKFLGLTYMVPAVTSDPNKAEYHISPIEAERTMWRLRSMYPNKKWYCEAVRLDGFVNTAMGPSFYILVRKKGTDTWRYYAGASAELNAPITTTSDMNSAKAMNIDDIRYVCECIAVYHKDLHYLSIPRPKKTVNANDITQYIKENPPRPIYMTFTLPKK